METPGLRSAGLVGQGLGTKATEREALEKGEDSPILREGAVFHHIVCTPRPVTVLTHRVPAPVIQGGFRLENCVLITMLAMHPNWQGRTWFVPIVQDNYE